jgi:hypothetical protein
MNQYCVNHTRVLLCTTVVVADNEELALRAFHEGLGDLEVHHQADVHLRLEEFV